MIDYLDAFYTNTAVGVTEQSYYQHTTKVGDVEVLVKEIAGHTYYAFRGTENVREWLRNFQVHKVPYNVKGLKTKVHRGFLRSWKEIRYALHEHLVSVPPDKRILCGHSAGAAIAGLCGTEYNAHRLITFGSPRWCGVRLAMDYPIRTIRMVNCFDPVVGVPLMMWGYAHVGERVYIDHKGKPRTRWTWMWRGLDRVIRWFGRPFTVRHDHHIKNYVEGARALLMEVE